MNFTLAALARSLKDYLAPLFPGVTFYEDPDRQGTKVPCLFLQQRYGDIRPHPGGRWLWHIGLELSYLVDSTLPNMQELYREAAQSLDLAMQTIPYTDGTGQQAALLPTSQREWRIDLNAMHYQFELNVWVTRPEDVAAMGRMEYTEETNHDGKAI